MEDITVFGFEKLVAWQESKQLVKKIYKIVEGLPEQEQYGLGNQIKRAALSVASNLAEGTGRTGFRDQAHFSQIAYGSLMEVACQSVIASELGLVSPEAYLDLRKDIETIARLISSLRSFQKRRVE
jgi:four helix bundle protein